MSVCVAKERRLDAKRRMREGKGRKTVLLRGGGSRSRGLEGNPSGGINSTHAPSPGSQFGFRAHHPPRPSAQHALRCLPSPPWSAATCKGSGSGTAQPQGQGLLARRSTGPRLQAPSTSSHRMEGGCWRDPCPARAAEMFAEMFPVCRRRAVATCRYGC
jgi:hypothetical protein